MSITREQTARRLDLQNRALKALTERVAAAESALYEAQNEIHRLKAPAAKPARTTTKTKAKK